MYRATLDRITGKFEFVEVPDKHLYYKDPGRALVEIETTHEDLTRLCFLHRGQPNPRAPQVGYWTCSDYETGLATGTGQSAQGALQTATETFRAVPVAHLFASIIRFIDENGRANMRPNRPVIDEGTVIVWVNELTNGYTHGRVIRTGKGLKHVTDAGTCVYVAPGPVIVKLEDIAYIWPTKEDLWPNN